MGLPRILSVTGTYNQMHTALNVIETNSGFLGDTGLPQNVREEIVDDTADARNRVAELEREMAQLGEEGEEIIGEESKSIFAELQRILPNLDDSNAQKSISVLLSGEKESQYSTFSTMIANFPELRVLNNAMLTPKNINVANGDIQQLIIESLTDVPRNQEFMPEMIIRMLSYTGTNQNEVRKAGYKIVQLYLLKKSLLEAKRFNKRGFLDTFGVYKAVDDYIRYNENIS